MFNFSKMCNLIPSGTRGEYGLYYGEEDHHKRLSDSVLDVLEAQTILLFKHWLGSEGYRDCEVRPCLGGNHTGIIIKIDPKIPRESRTNFLYFRGQLELLFTIMAMPEHFHLAQGEDIAMNRLE